MSQMSFSDFEFAGKRKQTRRERFFAEMDEVVLWSGLLALIEPYYPKAGGGRKRYPHGNHVAQVGADIEFTRLPGSY